MPSTSTSWSHLRPRPVAAPIPPSQPAVLSDSEQLPAPLLAVGPDLSARSGGERLSAPPSTLPLSHTVRQMATSPPPTSPFNVEDEGIPEASKDAYAAVLLDVNRWGSAWADCIRAFFRLEREAGFQLGDRRLPVSKLRPTQILAWMKKRTVSGPQWDALNTGDAEEFGESWWAWWADMQPARRSDQVSGLPLSRPTQNLDLMCLHRTGPNGLFFVVVCLTWWHNMAGSESPSWLDAVDDVRWALNQMLSQSQPADISKKRT